MQGSVSSPTQAQVPDEATAKQIVEYSQVLERLSTASRQFEQANRTAEAAACAEEAQRVLADIRRLRGEKERPAFPWAFFLPFATTLGICLVLILGLR